MVKEIKKKSLFKVLRGYLSDSKLFILLGIATLIIGLTFIIAARQQDYRQRALFEINTEFGFNTHISAANNNLDINKFKSNVDTLVANGQKWIRVNIIDFEVASESLGAVIPTATPTLTPPPTINTVRGLSTSPIQWNADNLMVYDNAIDYANAQGLKVFLVTNTPAYARNYSLDDYKSLTDEYYRFLANRYKGKVLIWQIFNKADVHSYRDYSPITSFDTTYLNELSQIITVAKNAIKLNDVNATITTNVGGYPMSDQLVTNWNQFFDGVKDAIDIISVDMYPAPDLSQISLLSTRIEDLKARYGKDVVVSEIGVCTLPGTYTEVDQQNYVTQAVNNLKLSSVKLILLYEIMDENSQNSSCEASFGILRTDGSQKSSFSTIMSAMHPLPTPTPSLAPTDTPTPTYTPTPTTVPTATPMATLPLPTITPLPINSGTLKVTVIPTINATIKIVNNSTGKIQLTATGSINNVSIPKGSYYVTFSYPKTRNLKTPRTTKFTINTGKTTEITGNFTTGNTIVTYK